MTDERLKVTATTTMRNSVRVVYGHPIPMEREPRGLRESLLALFGRRFTELRRPSVTAKDDASIAQYGERRVVLSEWAILSESFARELAERVLADIRQPEYYN